MDRKFIAMPTFVRGIVNLCFYIIHHPRKFYKYRVLRGLVARLSRFFPDRKYLKIMFPLGTGYELDLDNPQTFNEKLQWLKLNYHKPIFSLMVDKAEVKNYVSEIIGEEHIIPTYKVYDRVDEIDFEELPDQFVLKCTHDSGDLVICKDKSQLNRKKVLKQLKKGLKFDYYYMGREWVYKNIKHRIIAEKYMTDMGGELKDYKIFNFDGEPKIIEVDFNRFKDHRRHLYTTEWKKLDVTFVYPGDDTIFEKPKQLDQMLDFARKLSKGHPFIRTDFYIIDDIIYFGELTFYHHCGFGQITPFEFDVEMGKWIKLPQPTTKDILRKQHRLKFIHLIIRKRLSLVNKKQRNPIMHYIFRRKSVRR